MEPGFSRSLREELTRVLPEFQARVHRSGGLADEELVALVSRPAADPAVYHPEQASAGDVVSLSEATEEDEDAGYDMVERGEVAFVLLAGASARGTPKLFARIPQIGMTVLAWRLLQYAGNPVWVMSAPDMMKSIGRHLQEMALTTTTQGTVFPQFESYRLAPDNRIAWFSPGVPDLYSLGNGDLGPALADAKVWEDFPNVKRVVVSSVDNILANFHPGLLGMHARRRTPITCEVVDKEPEDKGGVLAWVNGRLQVAEDWRLPTGFADASPFYSTCAWVFETDVLKADIPWRWHRSRKQVNERLVVQHERLLQQYTEEFQTLFVRVPRFQRYLLARTEEQLEKAGAVLSERRMK